MGQPGMQSLRPIQGDVGSLRHRPDLSFPIHKTGQRQCPPRRSEVIHVTRLAQCLARSKCQVDFGSGGDGREPAFRSLCSGKARFPLQWRLARVCCRVSRGPLAASTASTANRLGLSVKRWGRGVHRSAFPCLGAWGRQCVPPVSTPPPAPQACWMSVYVCGFSGVFFCSDWAAQCRSFISGAARQ